MHVGTDKLKRQAAARSASQRHHRGSPAFNQSTRGLDLGETFTKEALSQATAHAAGMRTRARREAPGSDDDAVSVGDLSEIGSDDSRLASALDECRREETAFQERQAELAQQAPTSDDEGSDDAEFAAVMQSPPLRNKPRSRVVRVAHVAVETGVHHSIRCESTENKQQRSKVTARLDPGQRHRGVPNKSVAKHVPQLDLLSITASPYAQPVKSRRR